MKYLKFLIPMGIFLVLVLFLGAGLKLDPKEVPSPLIGKPAPAFALARLDDPAQTIRRDMILITADRDLLDYRPLRTLW